MNWFAEAILIYCAVSLLYFGYAGVMNFKRALDADLIPKWVVYAVGIWAVLTWLLDVAVNWLVMTLVFLEWPQEKTVTERLTRLEEGSGLRAWLAHRICKLLDPLDPSGEHCK